MRTQNYRARLLIAVGCGALLLSACSSAPPATSNPQTSQLLHLLGPAISSDLYLATGRHSVNVDGVRLSFSIPAQTTRFGWEHFGSLYISNNTQGSQAAEAIIFWTTFPGGAYADPCPGLLLVGEPVGPSVADLAQAVATVPGSGPAEVSNVTLGGHRATRVVLTVGEDVGCDPGFFFHWTQHWGGAFWDSTSRGDWINVWIVEVDGKRVVVEAETRRYADDKVKKEIGQIIGSIQFE